MRASAATLEKLRGEFQPAAYVDAYGVWRIGYGTRSYAAAGGRKAIKPGDQCTRQEAEHYFKCDVLAAQRTIERVIHVALMPGQYDALVMHVYRRGALPTKLKQCINSGDTEGFFRALREEIRITDRRNKRRYTSPALALQREEEIAIFKAVPMP
jgi:GH24 family phage-related lysozyme (muramidase)